MPFQNRMALKGNNTIMDLSSQMALQTSHQTKLATAPMFGITKLTVRAATMVKTTTMVIHRTATSIAMILKINL